MTSRRRLGPRGVLIEHVIGSEGLRSQVCLGPACGGGHMATVLSEYFGSAKASESALSEGASDYCAVDYQPLLTRAVANLPSTSTVAMRHAIYERARKAQLA